MTDRTTTSPEVARTSKGPSTTRFWSTRRTGRRLLAPGLMVAGAAMLALAAGVQLKRHWVAPLPTPTVAYSAVLAHLAAHQLDSLTIVPGREVIGWTTAAVGAASERAEFPTTSVDGIVQKAEDAGVPVRFESPHAGAPELSFNLALNILLIAALGLVAFRYLRNSNGGQVGRRTGSSTTFADVAGNTGATAELREVIEFLRAPERFRRLGARTPKGVLLFGAPGTGKTLMARAVAGEAGVPFWSISGSEITGFVVGLGVMRIKSLFRKARRHGGVIFIDEIDALGGRRGRNQSHNEDDRTLNQLLVELDGFSPMDGVVVIAATNRPDTLDPALLRPGRFDRSVTVALPTGPEREAILRLHVERRAIPLGAQVDLGRLARLMPQSSGADLANLVNEAAIAAARDASPTVEWPHLEQARDRMLLGKERSGFEASDVEWNTVAWHEAGHAIAGVLCCPEDGLHKVTIQPRGQAMGVAFFAPDDDRHLHSRRYLEGQILKGLGGRAAEEIVFGHEAITSGARSDLQHVTRVAREMVYHLGMGESTGLVVYDEQAGPPSAETHRSMDADVRSLIERLYARVKDVLTSHRAALDALAGALLEHETIDGPDALRLLEAHGLAIPAVPALRRWASGSPLDQRGGAVAATAASDLAGGREG